MWRIQKPEKLIWRKVSKRQKLSWRISKMKTFLLLVAAKSVRKRGYRLRKSLTISGLKGSNRDERRTSLKSSRKIKRKVKAMVP